MNEAFELLNNELAKWQGYLLTAKRGYEKNVVLQKIEEIELSIRTLKFAVQSAMAAK